MWMRRAPASSAFSSSSFTTDAGRSTTSPAAILLATCSGSTWMRPMGGTSSQLSAFRKANSCWWEQFISAVLLFCLLLLQLGLKCFLVVVDKGCVSGTIDKGICLAPLFHLLALAKHVVEAAVRAEEDVSIERV